MKKAVILKCLPQSRFHFGRVGLDVNTSLNDSSIIPHSDTLFSAMIHVGARLLEHDAEVDALVDLFRGENAAPKVKISSGCYCLENAKGDFLYFLPKPLHLNLIKTEHPKDLKKIQFISKEVWELGLNPNDWKTKCKIIDKLFVVTEAEYDHFQLSEQAVFFKEIALPKVTVHKEDKKDSFFYQTTIQIMPLNENVKVHYYFLLETQDLVDSETNLLNQILDILPYEGIGGERTTGCGLFESVVYEDFDLKVPNANRFVTISLTNPQSDAEFKAFENYQIVTRGGRQLGQSNQQFLKKVNMIAEGALVNQAVQGRLVSIAPKTIQQPYFRNGICMTLPFTTHGNLK